MNSLWFDALGVLCVAGFQGYLLMFAMRRLLPPINPSLKGISGTTLIALLAAIGITGPIGMSSAVLPQGSMVGPYGVGLVLGLAVNLFIVRRAELHQLELVQIPATEES
jgi:hypothetical protein